MNEIDEVTEAANREIDRLEKEIKNLREKNEKLRILAGGWDPDVPYFRATSIIAVKGEEPIGAISIYSNTPAMRDKTQDAEGRPTEGALWPMLQAFLTGVGGAYQLGLDIGWSPEPLKKQIFNNLEEVLATKTKIVRENPFT